MKFGKLEEVNVRELWKHEQYDFSEWLSKDENIELLSEEVGLTLTDINKEVFVGSYRCDLVAKDETTGIKVIIEIHAYQIGDSLPAPKFVVVEKPNDFSKTTKGNNESGELSKAQAERLNFWNEFNEIVASRNKPFNIRKATTDHWYDVAIGTSEAHISITLVNKISSIGIEIYINDNKALFDKLNAISETIENELGFTMDWQRLDNKKASRIIYYIEGLDFDNHGNYNELINETIDKVIRVKDTFKKYL